LRATSTASKSCTRPVSWSAWPKVPDDLAEWGRRYDAQCLGGVTVELKSHVPIERQVRFIGATWLDQQLISGGSGLGELSFGSEAKQAMQQRADSLAKQGLAKLRGQRVTLARPCWTTAWASVCRGNL